MFPLLRAAMLAQVASAALSCGGRFQKISAWEFAAGLNPGWNAGNTLDAIPAETSWGQQPLTNQTFTNAKNKGFRGIRIPVTWKDHFISDAPDYTVDPSWLQRVSDVVDYALTNDLFAVVNAHHDSWSWLNPDTVGFDATQTLDKFYRLWFQIGTALGCKSSKLAFETINEPSGDASNPANGQFVNDLHATMVKAVRDAGGFNKDRVVLLCGLGDRHDTAAAFLQVPQNMTNPWALTWHMYSPWAFTVGAFGNTLWGSDSDKQSMYDDISWARGNFSNVPIIIGEFGIQITQTEPAARWKYFDFVVQAARNLTTSVMLWDASGTFAPNTAWPYGDPTALDIITHAARGIHNALADSSEDTSAPSFWSSAQLFQKQGDPIQDTNLPFLFNGKRLTHISCSGGPCPHTLRKGVDYTTNSQNVTFTKAFMKRLFPSNAQPGLRATMVFHFDKGAADLSIPAYLWARPTLATKQVSITSATAQSDLWIPVTYAGLPKVAMVVAQEANGEYLIDSWTQWLPPMLRGNTKYSTDWNYNATHVAITAGSLQAVVAANVSTVFTFEFHPRTGTVATGDNNVNVTVTPL